MMGVTDPQRSPGAALFVQFFVCARLTSWGMAMIPSHAGPIGGRARDRFWHPGLARVRRRDQLRDGKSGTKPVTLWAIETGYNLVSFICAAVILSAWH
jgi:hypothetical protein